MFTTVASYHDPIEAHIACGRLRAEGIEAFLVGETFMRAPDPGAALKRLFA